MTTTAERLAEVIAGAAADLQAGKSIDRHNDSLRRLIAELGRGSGELGVTALMQALGPALAARGVSMPPLDRFPPAVAAFLEAADEVVLDGGALDMEAAADKLERAAATAFGGRTASEARAQELRERIRREVSASLADTLRAQGLTPAADMEDDEPE